MQDLPKWAPYVIPAVLAIGAIFVMQYRLDAQAEDIQELESKTVLKETFNNTKDDVGELKDEVKTIRKEQIEQGKLLERIAQKLEVDSE